MKMGVLSKIVQKNKEEALILLIMKEKLGTQRMKLESMSRAEESQVICNSYCVRVTDSFATTTTFEDFCFYFIFSEGQILYHY